METLESRGRKRRRKENIQAAVLGTIAVVGAIAIIAIAPALPAAIASVVGRRRIGYQARTAAGRLAQKGLVSFEKRGGATYLRITAKGERMIAIEQAQASLAIKQKRRWDKRYRMVIFDIPQSRRGTRDRLRELMRAAGFYRLQQSVWVHPYDCEELITLVKAELRLGGNVLYAIVEEIENDTRIKDHFGLS